MHGSKVTRLLLPFPSVKGTKNFLPWNLEVRGVCRVHRARASEWGRGKTKGVSCHLAETVVRDPCYLSKKTNYHKQVIDHCLRYKSKDRSKKCSH